MFVDDDGRGGRVDYGFVPSEEAPVFIGREHDEGGKSEEKESVRLALGADLSYQLVLDASCDSGIYSVHRVMCMMRMANLPPFSRARLGAILSGIRI